MVNARLRKTLGISCVASREREFGLVLKHVGGKLAIAGLSRDRLGLGQGGVGEIELPSLEMDPADRVPFLGGWQGAGSQE